MIEDSDLPGGYRHLTYVNGAHYYTDSGETVYVEVGKDGRLSIKNTVVADSPYKNHYSGTFDSEEDAEKAAIRWMSPDEEIEGNNE